MDKIEETLYLLHNLSLPKEEKESLLKGEPFDWDSLMSSARQGGFLNTLYYEIKTLDIKIPEDKLDILKRGYLLTLSKNLIKLREILAICDRMNRRCIDYVLIQGWALIFALYDDMGLRDSIDLDIYIPPKDLKDCAALFAELGYSASSRKRDHLNFCKKGRDLLIELSGDPFKLTAPMKNSRRFAQESVTREVEKIDIRVPSYEYILLGLIVHFQREKLYWPQAIYEIAALTHRKKDVLDWKRFLTISHEERLNIPAYFSLRIAYNLFKPAIPESVFDGLDSGRFQKELFLRMRPDYAEWLNGRRPERAARSTLFLYDWLTRNNLRQKIGFAFTEAFSYKYRGPASIPRLNEPLFRKFTKYASAWISLFLKKG